MIKLPRKIERLRQNCRIQEHVWALGSG